MVGGIIVQRHAAKWGHNFAMGDGMTVKPAWATGLTQKRQALSRIPRYNPAIEWRAKSVALSRSN